ncbi:COP9 signalosome complex subunit 1 [Drosophila guanche]|uniref:Blast:COP9 signalosome complex subunit 1 n=1 Tax=Drosophila guanche TaxID=7266 RepID=A0A3B0KVA4_DROGU|nr:COP9 signalosome complex subunit 1 [Drosophila guanche]SPP89786.1 blast:COP9 signalosome complex subunit 1 [Drosophila guanche]
MIAGSFGMKDRKEDVGSDATTSVFPTVAQPSSIHLPTYANRYTDIPRLNRLKFIAKVCPKLRVPALELAISHVKTTYNVKLYDELYKTLSAAIDKKEAQMDMDEASINSKGNASQAGYIKKGPVPYDAYWVEDNTMESTLLQQELDAELNYKKANSGSAKVRRILEEIGDYHLKRHNLKMAVKYYGRARPYSTNSDNVINMFRNLIRVSIYMANWWHVLTYIEDAKKYAFGFDNLSQKVPPRLNCAAGLANMGLKIYKTAAHCFLLIPFDRYDFDNIVAPEDVSYYAGLCALATLDQEMLDLGVINSEGFRPFFQLSPLVLSLLTTFHAGDLDHCLLLLHQIEDHVRLDYYLAPHVDTLFDMIKVRIQKKRVPVVPPAAKTTQRFRVINERTKYSHEMN